MSLFSEMKRRNVLRVAVAYLAVAWLLIQIVETLFPVFEFSNASIRLVVVLLAIGFPLVLIISWVYELTPEGLKLDRETDRSTSLGLHRTRKLDRAIIVVLVVAVGYFAIDKFALDHAPDAGRTQNAGLLAPFEKSIAVLPFENLSTHPEGEVFTNGVHDALITRLMGIADMRVIARTSVRRYHDEDQSIPEIANELSVANIVEAGVGLDGNKVYVNARLFDGETGDSLWADEFERERTSGGFFAIQGEIAAAIVSRLNATLSPAEEDRVYGMPTSSMQAYHHYMRGRHFLDDRSVE